MILHLCAFAAAMSKTLLYANRNQMKNKFTNFQGMLDLKICKIFVLGKTSALQHVTITLLAVHYSYHALIMIYVLMQS